MTFFDRDGILSELRTNQTITSTGAPVSSIFVTQVVGHDNVAPLKDHFSESGVSFTRDQSVWFDLCERTMARWKSQARENLEDQKTSRKTP